MTDVDWHAVALGRDRTVGRAALGLGALVGVALWTFGPFYGALLGGCAIEPCSHVHVLLPVRPLVSRPPLGHWLPTVGVVAVAAVVAALDGGWLPGWLAALPATFVLGLADYASGLTVLSGPAIVFLLALAAFSALVWGSLGYLLGRGARRGWTRVRPAAGRSGEAA